MVVGLAGGDHVINGDGEPFPWQGDLDDAGAGLLQRGPGPVQRRRHGWLHAVAVRGDHPDAQSLQRDRDHARRRLRSAGAVQGVMAAHHRQGQGGIAILAFGSMLAPALEAAAEFDATVANMRFVKPLDEQLVRELAAKHRLLVTIEENVVMGGAGSAVVEALRREARDRDGPEFEHEFWIRDRGRFLRVRRPEANRTRERQAQQQADEEPGHHVHQQRGGFHQRQIVQCDAFGLRKRPHDGAP